MATILVVDDEPDTRNVLAILLRLQGFDALTAGDGQEALETLKSRPVDLVITDVMMPRLDGLSLCRRLREDPAHRRIPIIVNSAGMQEPPGKGELFEVFMTKPPPFEQQLAHVRRLLGL